MALSNVEPFKYPENFTTHQLFYYETGCSVFIKTIFWLTGTEVELKERLKTNSNLFQKYNRVELAEYVDGFRNIEEFDLSLLYAILTKVCGLNDSFIHTHDELENLLKRIKDVRNDFSHPDSKQKNITDVNLENEFQELNLLLPLILDKAGQKGNVNISDINEMKDIVHEDLKRIKECDDPFKLCKPKVKNLILSDLKEIHLQEKESSFKNTLEGYSIPYLKEGDSGTSSNLASRLSDIHFQTPFTVVLGESGAGKTAMTKFLYYSWLNENTEALEELAEYDIVLRIQCNKITSRDLNLYFEKNLPKAAEFFNKTSSMSRHLKNYKVLWIMDGFEESTPEFCGFLESIIDNFPPLHKILITTRKHAFQNLKKYFKEIATFNLDKLHDDNMEEILEYRITDIEQRESFKKKFNSLTMAEKILLETPIIFIMYIDLWGSSISIEEGSISLTKLYTASTQQQLTRLLESHENNNHSRSEKDLHLSIENWFYGSLCKQSFANVVAGKYFLDSVKIDKLERDATNGYLIPSDCLSSFLKSDQRAPNGYNFKHLAQMVHFAALFMRKHPEDSSFDLEGDYFIRNTKLEMIYCLFEMIIEDDAIGKSSEGIFSAIQKLILSFKEFDQGFLWHELWISTYLNPYIKEGISLALKSCFYVDMRTWKESSLIELIKHIEPKKVVINITNSDYHQSSTDDIISELLNCLHQFDYGKLQIELRPSFTSNDEQIIKSQIMNRYKNAKHHLIYYELVSGVIVQALRWLYKGQEPLEMHLEDLVSDNASCLSSTDICLLRKLAEGNFTIEELDPALLLKIAKIIYEVDVRNISNWRKSWGNFTQDDIKFSELINDFNSLPHHLSKGHINIDVYSDIFPGCDDKIICELIKEVVAHNISFTGVMNEDDEIKKDLATMLLMVAAYKTNNVKTEGIKNKIETIIKENMTESNFPIKNDFDFHQIKSILTGAGNGASHESGVINESIDHLQKKLIDLSLKTNFDIISTIHAKNIILKELLTQYESDKAYFDKDMGRYIPATLLDGDMKIDLSDISFKDCKVVFVQGDSGMGKSTMTRCLFASWARGVMDSVVWLKSFDIVFLVNGKRNQCKFLSELLEFLIPRSCNIIPTTNLLRKQLDKMDVLWICDGFDSFDETESKLLYRLDKRLFKSHKFLYTSRELMPIAYRIANIVNREMDMSDSKFYKISLTDMENIHSFLSKCNLESRFSTLRDSLTSRLDECNNDLLYNPFYSSVYVELLQSETKGTLHLYSKCKLNETMLLVNQTNLRLHQLKDSHEYSDSKIDKWFYGSLCKQSYSMIYTCTNTLQCKNLEEILGGDAVKDNLDPLKCLDFFLVKEHNGAGGAKYGFSGYWQPYILASFFLKKWKDYPPLPEKEDIKKGLLRDTVFVLNSFIIMAIYENLNETCAKVTAKKVASAYDLEDECLLWYNICAVNNFQGNIMKFVTNILDGFDCYVLSYEMQTISDLVKFFTFFSPKAIRFTSIYWNKYKFSKEAYLDLLNVLKEKPLDIFIGPIDSMSVGSLRKPGGEFIGVKILDLINAVASLNITFFEGKVEDLLLLGNHFGKLKKLDLRVLSADIYHELCTTLPSMAQLEEVSLSFFRILSQTEIYPVNFVTRTTLICREPEIFSEFIRMFQRIKGETTAKFQRLIIKNWSSMQWRKPDGLYETYREDIVNHFPGIIKELFSEIVFAPETNAFLIK